MIDPHVIDVRDLQASGGYGEIVQRVLNYGEVVSPRGQKTLEIGPATIVVRDPRRVVPLGQNRKLNMAIGAAESCHLLGGVSDAAQMVSVTKNFEQFVEDGRLRGAYGPRTYSQFPRVAELLRRDPDTRQAGVVLWREPELASLSRDVPCTVELHFAVRRGRLNMYTTMRSNDVFWGVPYDFWMFSNVLHAMAYATGYPVGLYVHTALSLHVYVDRDMGKINDLKTYDARAGDVQEVPMLVDDFEPLGPEDVHASKFVWGRIANVARAACLTGPVTELLPSAAWYARRLAPHFSYGMLCWKCRYVMPGVGCTGC